ncbi:divergent polysaccharide deacetylase family protein [Candidatus Solincola tengchongensis]|uniref:divergent polysaccharide deacetylase family protein n=1 Tax=Candidatus Solincola tengchongensis TaxID=2900693 RepID=UPI00257CFCE8|nr:divergent polysaccharide deacetylase family protein [Candidatus Solincola tengchongensis]
MEDREFRVDMRRVMARRRRMRRLRRLRWTCIAAGSLALLLVGFLFSPWGPCRSVFFGRDSGEEAAGGAEQGAAVTSPVTAGEYRPEQEEGGTGESGQAREPAREEKASIAEPPAVAIVVDDTGADVGNLERWLAVDAPLTFAVLPHCRDSASTADRLYYAGYRIMMHIPTENDPPHSYSGAGQLSVGMSREAVFATLDGDLATVPHAKGINNHQGGRGCNDYPLMYLMCEWARERGLYVVDSDSSTRSQVTRAAQELGFPRRRSQVFIDHQNEPEYIREAMRRMARIARQEGTAVGICHFHRPNTPSVVGEMIRELREEGIHFAFVEDIQN